MLYEELKECAYPNKTNPGDTVGALTYVESLEEHVSGDIEAIHIRTIGTYVRTYARAILKSIYLKRLYQTVKDIKSSVLILFFQFNFI